MVYFFLVICLDFQFKFARGCWKRYVSGNACDVGVVGLFWIAGVRPLWHSGVLPALGSHHHRLAVGRMRLAASTMSSGSVY